MIQEIKKENLFKEVAKLKQGEHIYIDVDAEACNRLKLAGFQKKSYENLFISYINNTIDDANKIKLDKFLKAYTELCIKENVIFKEAVIGTIGKDIYLYLIENNIKVFIDTELIKIDIYK